MTQAEILDTIREHYPDCLLADGFEDAIVGIVEGWFDHSQHAVVCYDFRKCVELLMADSEMDEEEAEEYLHFNTLGAYVGPYTPVFLYDWRKTEAVPAL